VRRGLPLHVDEVHGDASGWANRVIHGEAERVLPTLLPALRGRVALVYVDPPFDTGGSFAYLATLPGHAKTDRLAVPAYRDARGLDAWLAWFTETAALARDLLAPGGSFYAHLDAHAAHYAKVALDEVFGTRAFQREIVWRIGWVSGFKSRARSWIRNHDTILFYAKGPRPSVFHKPYAAYPPGYVRRDGVPPTGKGRPLEDVWNASDLDRLDSIQIVSFSGEKVGYPTQKNEALVARIVAASSSPGDLVLDACAGSGTAAVVAAKLGRRFVVCDASAVAIHATRKRLVAIEGARPFTVEHAGKAAGTDGALVVKADVEGRGCTLRLASWKRPGAAPVARDGLSVLEGWCVDWENDGGPLRARTSLWRAGKHDLPLAATHDYDRPGRYRVLVKAFDALGGSATTAVHVVLS
jgi:DNA methylase